MQEDLISRQAEIDELNLADDKGEIVSLLDVLQIIKALPPAEPRWIPCSETTEIPEHEVIACDAYGEEMFGYLSSDGENWECDSDQCLMRDVVAWMEKPKPYRPEGDDKHEG